MDNGGSSERVEVVDKPSLRDRVVEIAERFSPGLGEMAIGAGKVYRAAMGAVPDGGLGDKFVASMIAAESAVNRAGGITNVPVPGAGAEEVALNLPDVNIPELIKTILGSVGKNDLQFWTGTVLLSVVAGGFGGAAVGYAVRKTTSDSIFCATAGMILPYYLWALDDPYRVVDKIGKGINFLSSLF